MNLLQLSTIFKQKNNRMKFFTTPNSKNIIATVHIVTTKNFELTFLLMLYSHDYTSVFMQNFLTKETTNFFLFTDHRHSFCTFQKYIHI